ncbi:UvrD-helicase domain-containing protein [Nanchangia anserum]|uniref:DNA 3'-5' helicase n=1 Tax=Nanchangia anserum TaxID=2692125 RepID=A0A8I0KR70_9ACTO|nr:UvrD-helicase domain-containing protein [Nanchangia anserum]MBD3689137.1 UvrD-helicase domain-containing protein [Nanchangia anserum]QOX81371.1 UvrD-helicase domain-containing protein [Nanchangia anserum]
MTTSPFDALIAATTTRRSALPHEAPLGGAWQEQATVGGADVESVVAGLNERQREAVEHRGTPLLVTAGAGSGKTRVLTRRIAHLLATGDARASEILAITFTNKAAAEMRERVHALVGPEARFMQVSTFHSLCVRILREHHEAAGLRSTFSIYDAADSARLMKMVADEVGIDTKRTSERVLCNRVSDLKNELVGPAEYAERFHRDPVAKAVAEVYPLYQRRLADAHAVDFDDLIMTTVMLLRDNAAVAEHFHRRFRHILVDEYQDTNHAQYVLVTQLVGNGRDGVDPGQLTVVGDSDQSIYAFRGATIRNIEQFGDDFPGAREVILDQNYRSTQNILSAANAVIGSGQGQRSKNLWTDQGSGDKIVVNACPSDRAEAQFVGREIETLHKQGRAWSDFAIFFRTNAQSRLLEEMLMGAGMPYRLIGGTKFYERKEIKDAIAYLRAASNPDDTVNMRRIVNEPRRGIGPRALGSLLAHADTYGVSFGVAIAHVWAAVARELGQDPASTPGELAGFDTAQPSPDVVGLGKAARANLHAFWQILIDARAADAAGRPPAEILDSLMDATGYLGLLQASDDPQDGVRAENLAELHAVAEDFAIAEPDGRLADFLERISLVADADQLADVDDGGQITLMTIHTAKGLEFPVVFVTGMEDGTFPHSRSLGSASELDEERRLAYVAITRARELLYLTRAGTRTQWGTPMELPASRFLDALPPDVTDVRDSLTPTERIRAASPSYGSGAWGGGRVRSRGQRRIDRNRAGSSTPPTQPKTLVQVSRGDRVNHDTFGLGRVVETGGSGASTWAKVDFGDGSVKRLLLRYAPMEKL